MKNILILAIVLFAGCGTPPKSTIDPNIIVDSTYSSISKNILNKSCINCHGQSGGYSYESYNNTIRSVSPGFPDSSPMYLALKSGRMPQVGPKLSDQQLQSVKNWISNGAKND